MKGLVDYDSDSEVESTSSVHTSLKTMPVMNSAPNVDTFELSKSLTTSSYEQIGDKSLALNLPLTISQAPQYGPINPCHQYGKNLSQEIIQVGNGKEVVTGIIETTHVEDLHFEAQYHTYNQIHAGNYRNKRAIQDKELNTDMIISKEQDTVFTQKKIKRSKKFNDIQENLGNPEEDGIWAPYKTKTILNDVQAGTLNAEQEKIRAEYLEKKNKKSIEEKKYDEEMDFDRLIEKKTGHLLPARLKAGQTALEGKSSFLGSKEYDYLGRSWVEPPRGVRPDDEGAHDVFLPKRCVHKWIGHTKGVQSIELYPRYGHLLLSGSMDNTCRIWDVAKEKECQRIYEGHSGAVRGINFATDGKHFLSCSFDRFIQLWDTETGQAIHSFTNRRVPYCIKYYPDGNNNIFLIGDSNNMIVQFDTRSGEIVQEYNHHLQAVSSVTFVDDNRRFVSTSDDKKILIWDFGIPVPIKYISEPGMHAMPAVSLHPTGDYFVGQSMNNQIDVYAARDRFKLVRKKIFKGHTNAGYACQIGFSPRGQYMISGDGDGKLCIWDWKSCKMLKKLPAHNRGPCMGALWHPIEPSKVITCGWDGVIKYWD